MTTTLLPVPRPSRLRPWVRVLLWAVALVGALLVASVLSVAAAPSGGVDDLLDPSSPTPADAQVVASQERALRDLRALDLPVAGAPLARAEGSTCVCSRRAPAARSRSRSAGSPGCGVTSTCWWSRSWSGRRGRPSPTTSPSRSSSAPSTSGSGRAGG